MTDQTPSERLESGVADLHVPEPRTDRETRSMRVGLVTVVGGLVVIGAGWWGASGTRDVSEQIPYLISGGLLGLALVVFGTAVFLRYSVARLFRFWLARSIAEHQLQTDRVVEALGSDRVAP